MKAKYIKFCKRCNTETEHYANGNCIPCQIAYLKNYNQEHRIDIQAYEKAYYQLHKEAQRAYHRVYQISDSNNNDIPKRNIRRRSNYILFKQRNHTKLKNYEIHHCFGYDNPNKFIYIPKDLHLQIHQRLSNKGISASAEHFEQIKDLINECQDYTYISI